MIDSKLIKSLFNDSLLKNKSLDNYDLIRNNIAKVSIGYQDMMQTFISEYPKMKSADLVSSIGGLIGLFMGLSFLSFIEIFDILIQILFVLMEKIRKNNIKVSAK